MKTLSYTLCAVLAAGFAFTGDAQVKPKSKKVTELKYLRSNPSTMGRNRI